MISVFVAARKLQVAVEKQADIAFLLRQHDPLVVARFRVDEVVVVKARLRSALQRFGPDGPHHQQRRNRHRSNALSQERTILAQAKD